MQTHPNKILRTGTHHGRIRRTSSRLHTGTHSPFPTTTTSGSSREGTKWIIRRFCRIQSRNRRWWCIPPTIGRSTVILIRNNTWIMRMLLLVLLLLKVWHHRRSTRITKYRFPIPRNTIRRPSPSRSMTIIRRGERMGMRGTQRPTKRKPTPQRTHTPIISDIRPRRRGETHITILTVSIQVVYGIRGCITTTTTTTTAATTAVAI